MPPTNDPYHSYRTAASALSLTTMGIASLVLIGWSFGMPVLTSVVPELASMKVTTAFGFTPQLQCCWCSRGAGWRTDCLDYLRKS